MAAGEGHVLVHEADCGPNLNESVETIGRSALTLVPWLARSTASDLARFFASDASSFYFGQTLDMHGDSDPLVRR